MLIPSSLGAMLVNVGWMFAAGLGISGSILLTGGVVVLRWYLSWRMVARFFLHHFSIAGAAAMSIVVRMANICSILHDFVFLCKNK